MNKEEHLGRETAAFLKPRGSIGQGEATLLLRLSDVLAERDAAREELAQARNRIEFLENGAAPVDAAQPAAVDLVAWIEAQREFSLAAFGPGSRTKGVIAHIRKELAEVEADPDGISEWIDVVILALDGAWRAGHEPREIADALWAKLEVNKSRSWPDWRTKREDEPIEHVKAAQPGPLRLLVPRGTFLIHRTFKFDVAIAPHDGDTLSVHLGAHEARLQLPAAHPESAPVVGGVTEEMLDEIGFHAMATNQLGEAIDRARAAIRAQKRVDVELLRKLAESLDGNMRDMTAKVIRRAIGDEPAVEAPKAEPQTKTCTVEPTAEQLAQLRELRPYRRPAAEPAAPAQEQEGPFTDNGGFGWINDNGVAQLKAINEEAAKRYTRLLNAGLEAPKLRARVAELEYEQQRVSKAVAGGLRDETMMVGSLVWDVVGLKARADAAEKELHQNKHERRSLTQKIIDAIGSNGPENLEHAVERILAKLAALGENPIPRALGERWHSYASGLQSGAWFAELLAGREPGAAS